MMQHVPGRRGSTCESLLAEESVLMQFSFISFHKHKLDQHVGDVKANVFGLLGDFPPPPHPRTQPQLQLTTTLLTPLPLPITPCVMRSRMIRLQEMTSCVGASDYKCSFETFGLFVGLLWYMLWHIFTGLGLYNSTSPGLEAFRLELYSPKFFYFISFRGTLENSLLYSIIWLILPGMFTSVIMARLTY